MGAIFESLIIVSAFIAGIVGFDTIAVVLILFAIYELLHDMRKNGIPKKG